MPKLLKLHAERTGTVVAFPESSGICVIQISRSVEYLKKAFEQRIRSVRSRNNGNVRRTEENTGRI
jgi:hypothetical protein